jgi:hypothetical protein
LLFKLVYLKFPMEPLTIILIAIAFFIAFLMLTSGHRKHALRKALNELETERMRLLKSIEHIKLSFYQRKLGEKEAQDKIFELEEKLRGLESKILDIKEKPLMRTLKKQKQEENAVEDTVEEEREVARAEGALLNNMSAKAIVVLFLLLVIIVIVAMGLAGTGRVEGERETISIPMSAIAVPEGGIPPGSNGGIRTSLTNTHHEDLRDVMVWAKAPEGSGIRFESGEIDAKAIPIFESGGARELYFGLSAGKNTSEGDYIIRIEAFNEEGLESETSATLKVRIGRPDESIIL